MPLALPLQTVSAISSCPSLTLPVSPSLMKCWPSTTLSRSTRAIPFMTRSSRWQRLSSASLSESGLPSSSRNAALEKQRSDRLLSARCTDYGLRRRKKTQENLSTSSCVPPTSRKNGYARLAKRSRIPTPWWYTALPT